MLPDMVGAVIYVRVSTKEQTENLSLATQLKACEDYCDRQAFHILARFREEGESAKAAERRNPAGRSAGCTSIAPSAPRAAIRIEASTSSIRTAAASAGDSKRR